MGRKEAVTSATVVLGVEEPLFLDGKTTAEQYRLWTNSADSLVAEVERHCDDYDSVEIDYQVESFCSHCGAEWTEGEDSQHNGGCCDEDAKAMDPYPNDAGMIAGGE